MWRNDHCGYSLHFQSSFWIFFLYDHQFTWVLPEDITLTCYLKLKSCCLLLHVFFRFPLSAYSEKDGFMEAVVPVEEITTSPASFPGDINSTQVKIVPTQKISAGTSARTKEKGKWKQNYTYSNLQHSTVPVPSYLRIQHFSQTCTITLFSS